MRARYTRSLGLTVIGEETGDVLGALNGMILNPDTGVVEGFFVRTAEFWAQEKRLFLCRSDILRWGARIAVRGRDALASVDDLVRISEILEGKRQILGQKIVTESGFALGRCADVQFNTASFRLEWLFPRRFFRWGVPIPASQILEVRPEAVVVKDPPAAETEVDAELIPTLPEAA